MTFLRAAFRMTSLRWPWRPSLMGGIAAVCLACTVNPQPGTAVGDEGSAPIPDGAPAGGDGTAADAPASEASQETTDANDGARGDSTQGASPDATVEDGGASDATVGPTGSDASVPNEGGASDAAVQGADVGPVGSEAGDGSSMLDDAGCPAAYVPPPPYVVPSYACPDAGAGPGDLAADNCSGPVPVITASGTYAFSMTGEAKDYSLT
jgi:hypothetical protein